LRIQELNISMWKLLIFSFLSFTSLFCSAIPRIGFITLDADGKTKIYTSIKLQNKSQIYVQNMNPSLWEVGSLMVLKGFLNQEKTGLIGQ
jgi:hypothetical protein